MPRAKVTETKNALLFCRSPEVSAADDDGRRCGILWCHARKSVLRATSDGLRTDLPDRAAAAVGSPDAVRAAVRPAGVSLGGSQRRCFAGCFGADVGGRGA